MLTVARMALNPAILRLLRLARLLRPLRLIRSLAMLDTLHLMMAALKSSVYVLFWAMMVIFVIVSIMSISLGAFLEPYMMDIANKENAKERLQAYSYFGTFSRSVLTIFELTFANWVPVTRFLHDNVSEWYGPLMLLYLCSVAFSVVSVIRAVFVVETFQAASSDNDLMIMRRERAIKHHKEKMQLLFEESDASGDGCLTYEEFKHVMNDNRVKAWLEAMDLEVRDSSRVFSLIDDGDRKISAEELVSGFSHLKGSARSVDMLSMWKDIGRLEARMKRICKHVLLICDKLDVNSV